MEAQEKADTEKAIWLIDAANRMYETAAKLRQADMIQDCNSVAAKARALLDTGLKATGVSEVAVTNADRTS